MNALILAILLQAIPALPARAALDNPSVANPVPKQVQKDYDKLWKRFLASKDAKEDAKISAELDKLLKKNPDLVSAILIQTYIDLYAGRQAVAEQRLETFLAKRPADRFALYYLAEAAYSRSEYVR